MWLMSYCRLELFCAEKICKNARRFQWENFCNWTIFALIRYYCNHYIRIEIFCKHIFLRFRTFAKIGKTIPHKQIPVCSIEDCCLLSAPQRRKRRGQVLKEDERWVLKPTCSLAHQRKKWMRVCRQSLLLHLERVNVWLGHQMGAGPPAPPTGQTSAPILVSFLSCSFSCFLCS